MDSGIPESKEAIRLAACLTLGFDSIAIYNGIELTCTMWADFKRYSGLYFWACLISTYGIAVYTVGFILNINVPSANGHFCQTLFKIGWIATATGQSMVLWFRLHLILHSQCWLKVAFCLIVSNAVICHLPNKILTLDVNVNTFLWGQPYPFYEKYQLTIFFIQELIVLGICISETFKLIQLRHTTQEPPGCGDLLHLLLFAGIVRALFDTTALGLVYAGCNDVLSSYQPFVYGIKLKMEFAILNQLGDLGAGKKTRHPIQGGKPLGRSSLTSGAWTKSSIQ